MNTSKHAHLDTFLQECIHKVIKQFISVVNTVGELADNPNHGRLGFRFI